MFFGGGGGGGGVFANGGIFDDGTNGRPFGFGPGIRVQQFGGGPRMRRRATPAGAEEVPAQPQNLTRIFWQLAPLILFFLLPMLSGLFGGDGAGAAPKFTMEPKGLYTQQRFTPAHKVPFYVNPKDVEPLGTREATRLGQRAETAIINQLNAMCSREELIRQQKLQDAQGFFFTNDVKAKEAREMDMPDCRRLEELGLPRRRQY